MSVTGPCTGRKDCTAERHLHGCYADTHGACDAPYEHVVAWAERTVQGLKSFTDEMREKGIHVGVGNPSRCTTCDVAWPCAESQLRQG